MTLTPTLLLLCADLVPSLALAQAHPLGESDLLVQTNATESNVSVSRPKEGSFADMIDKALENEFKENDQNEGLLDPSFFFLSRSHSLSEILWFS